MANPTAELFVKIGADTKELKKGMDAAEKRVGGFAKTIKKHHRAIGMAMAAMGAAILAVGALSVKAFAKMGDEVQKMALRTGFSTEALSELRHAAQLSGASLAGLEKASRTLSGAIMDAGFGLETYTRAFAQIGLTYADLAKLSPEKQFLAVMNALAGVESETVRAAIATDLFGRAGTQLLPMLVDGAEGLAAMRQEAHDLGIVFDQEAANKAAEFNDALTKLKGSVTGVMLEIGSLLVDYLKPLVDNITALIKKYIDWTDKHPMLSAAITKTALALGALLFVMGTLIVLRIPALIAVLVTWGKVLLFTIIPAVWSFVVALWAQVTATLAAMAATGVLIPAAIAAVAAIALLATGITLLVKNQREQYDSTNAVARATNALAETTSSYGNTATDAFNQASNALAGLTKETDRAIAATRELHGSERTLAAERYIFYKELAQQRDLTPTELRQMELFAEMIGIRPETPAAPSFIPRLGVGISPREAFIPQLQAGGIVTKPTLALVGEKGPEAIIPLDKMGGNITINFTEPVFMEREESINKLADRIYRVIKREQRLNLGVASG